MDIPGELIPIVLFIAVPITAIGWPIARALAKRIEKSADTPRIPAEVAARLERMEQGIDAIAIEIERISEAQRFTTKVLSERPREQHAALPGSPAQR